MKNIMIFEKLFSKASLAAILCCLFFNTFTFFSCTPLEDVENVEQLQEEESSQELIQQEETPETTEEEEADSGSTEEEAPAQEEKTQEVTDITINVYYSNDTAEYLVPESRIIPSENKYVDSLYELMSKPIDDSLVQLVPDTAKINSVIIEDGNALVDFSQEFLDDRIVSDTVDILLLYAVVNTLTQFPEVNSVSLYIDGEKLDILGQLDIREPVFRRTDLIKE